MKPLVTIFIKKLCSTFSVLAMMTICGGFAKADVPAEHGMLLFGQETTYASHLPMFHHPHNYQLVMELELVDVPRAQTLEEYEFLKDKGETFFTLVPEKMDLAQLISGKKVVFQALIYHEHFERGGKNLGPVNVKVNLILYSKKLDASQSQEPSNEYFVFGKNGEYFAAHVVKSKPSFDSILSISQPYEFSFPHCRTRVCTDPIPTIIGDDKLPLILTDTLPLPVEGSSLGHFFQIVDVKKIIYLEEAELQH